MLRIESQSTGRFCDGSSRRQFLQIGALGLGGLALPQLFQAEAAQGVRLSHETVIMIYRARARRLERPVSRAEESCARQIMRYLFRERAGHP